MNKKITEISLLKRIEKMKKEMIELANSKGINCEETITYSQEIDILLNLYMKDFGQKEKMNVLHKK